MTPLYTKTLTVNVQPIHVLGACTVLAIIGLTIVWTVRELRGRSNVAYRILTVSEARAKTASFKSQPTACRHGTQYGTYCHDCGGY